VGPNTGDQVQLAPGHPYHAAKFSGVKGFPVKVLKIHRPPDHDKAPNSVIVTASCPDAATVVR
jgi:hypothetical protein